MTPRPRRDAPQVRLYSATPETPLLIRTYEPRDRNTVWALHREGDIVTTSQYSDVDPEHEDDLRRLEDEYLSAGSCFWVAEIDGRVVGMTAIHRIDAETARLRRMRVTAARRRLGIAQRLLETAEQFCRDYGYRRMILDTTEQQTAAHRLYERAGFVRTGERTLGPFRIFDYRKELA